MLSENPELFSIITMIVVGVAIVSMVYCRNRNPLDPRVLFISVYTYLTVAPCIYCIFISGEYHPGLKIEYLGMVIYSCTTAIIGFATGATLALFGTKSLTFRPYARNSQHDIDTNFVVRLILLPICLAAIAACAYYGHRVASISMSAGQAKAFYALYADPDDLRALYYYGAVSTVCLIFLVVTDAYTGRDWRSPMSLVPIFLYLAVCFGNGERDALLVIAVWLLLNWKRIGPFHRGTILLFTAAWVGLAPLLRQVGLGMATQLSSVSGVSGADWLMQITHLSPNAHVFTNVAYDVPNNEPHWYGRSLLGAVASFLPGDFEFKEQTPTRWFAEIYTHQGTAGYAFSQDAEAYLNFGWIGPPIWYCVWGYVLGIFYRRATAETAKSVDVFVWWYFLAVSLFAIRADSRALLKMLVCGYVASRILWIGASILQYRRTRYLADQRQMDVIARAIR